MHLKTANEKNGVFHISLGPELKQEKTEKKFCHIDEEMIRYKLHFFLFMGGIGAISPFIPAFAEKELKLSATSFAAATSALLIIQSLSKPIIGLIVDYFNRLKLALGVFVIGAILFFFAFFLLPAIPSQTSNTTISEGSNKTYCGTASCDVYTRLSVSELEPGLLVEKNESFYNLYIGDVPLNISRVLCRYKKSSPSHQLNKSVLNLKGYRLSDKGTTMDVEVFLNISRPWRFTCRNERNASCVLHITDCILCCDHFSSCYMTSDNVYESNAAPSEPGKAILRDFKSYQFWLFAFVFVVMYMCMFNCSVLSDTACCESVQKTGADYGRQRLFGPLGYGLMSCVGGFLSDYTQSYVTACAVMAAMLLATLWNMSKIKFEKPNCSKTFFKDVGTAFCSKDFVAFQIGALVNGIGFGAILFNLVWFLMTMGGNNILFGLVKTVQKFLGDIPFMFFSGWMIQKMGHFHMTTLSLLTHCIRFLYLSYLQNPWYALLIEWTHGIIFGAYYVTLASFAKLSSKPGTETTMQAILFMTYDGLGASIGNIVTGLSIDYFGGHQTFYYTSIFFGCSTLISFGYSIFCRGNGICCRKTHKTYIMNS